MNISEVKELIAPEEWERTSVSSFSLDDFSRIAQIASNLETSEDKADFRQLCEDELSRNKASIPARILATITGKHPSDDRYLLEVLESAVEAHKYDSVEFLAKLMLNYSENDYALRVLADYYESVGKTDEKIAIWERLVRTDYEETEILKKLAEHYEQAGDLQTAMNYYQRDAQRLLKNQDYMALKELWDKIVSLRKDNPEYLIKQAERYAQALSANRGVSFLNDLLDRNFLNIDQQIDVLKKIIHYSTFIHQNIDKLLAKYREKYKDNPRLESCIKSTGLANVIPEVVETSIDQFETEIHFVEGSFVFHKTWQIGRIIKIDEDTMDIIFTQIGRHTMSCSMAYSSLKVLPKTHIWVLKAVVDHDKLKNRFQSDVVWALQTLISSNNGSATFKEMKAEIVPSILSQKEWAPWYAKAKKELMSNPSFGFSENDIESYVFRETPCTFEEKKLNMFRAEKSFFAKIRSIRDFIANKGDVEDEAFAKMIQFFEQKARIVNSNVENLSSWLFLNDLKTRKNYNFIQIDGSFQNYYDIIKTDVKGVFIQIDDSEIKRSFIEELISADAKNWPSIVKELFPYFLNNKILEELLQNKQKKVYLSIVQEAVDSYKEKPEVLLYLIKNLKAKDWEKAGITQEKLLISEIQLLNFVLLCINNKNDVQRYRRVQQALVQTIFDDRGIENFLSSADEDSARKIYSLISSSEYLDAGKKSTVRNYIIEKFSDYESILGEKKEEPIDTSSIIPTSLLCTQASLDAKLAELKHITDVEIPENAKEIGIARELGDLRENAEYQYGKDKQKNLTFLKGKLSKEISEARVVLPDQVDPSRISFGTKVTLKDNLTGKNSEYTVMGQWESDPSKGILNFKAPLCRMLYNHQKGDQMEFELNDVKFDFTVLDIQKVEF